MGHLRRENDRAPDPVSKFAAEISLVVRAEDEDQAQTIVRDVLSVLEAMDPVQLATSNRISKL
jgi:hypothetical protein